MFCARIVIKQECIQFVNIFDGTVNYTIWKSDFNEVRSLMEKCEKYGDELGNLERKYGL
jgi:hypothetical protein